MGKFLEQTNGRMLAPRFLHAIGTIYSCKRLAASARLKPCALLRRFLMASAAVSRWIFMAGREFFIFNDAAVCEHYPCASTTAAN